MTQKGGEIRITFIGSPHKSVIYDQLKEAALKMEKHVCYQDTSYFTFNVDNAEAVIELVDPGVEHTGAREMSIRKSDGAMLFYSAYSPTSFRQISELVNDFSHRKTDNKIPVLLISIEDEIMDDCCETSSTGQSSVSEGYESDTAQALPSENHRKRRPSMERIRASHEEGKISHDKGEQLARLILADCKFMPITLASFKDSANLIEAMIREIRQKQCKKRIRLLSHNSISKQQKLQETSECRETSTSPKIRVTMNGKKAVSSVCTIS